MLYFSILALLGKKLRTPIRQTKWRNSLDITALKHSNVQQIVGKMSNEDEDNVSLRISNNYRIKVS